MSLLHQRLLLSHLLLLIVTGFCVVTGCSSSEAQPIFEEEALTFPAEFEEEGTKWSKSASIEDADMKLLSGYFKKNSSMAEGPLISGDPTLYTSSKGTKRFYWGRAGAEEPEWMYIQFSGRKGTVAEGTGSPLSLPSE